MTNTEIIETKAEKAARLRAIADAEATAAEHRARRAEADRDAAVAAEVGAKDSRVAHKDAELAAKAEIAKTAKRFAASVKEGTALAQAAVDAAVALATWAEGHSTDVRETGRSWALTGLCLVDAYGTEFEVGGTSSSVRIDGQWYLPIHPAPLLAEVAHAALRSCLPHNHPLVHSLSGGLFAGPPTVLAGLVKPKPYAPPVDPAQGERDAAVNAFMLGTGVSMNERDTEEMHQRIAAEARKEAKRIANEEATRRWMREDPKGQQKFREWLALDKAGAKVEPIE